MSANRQHTQPAKAKESTQAIAGHVGIEVIELNRHHLKPGSQACISSDFTKS